MSPILSFPHLLSVEEIQKSDVESVLDVASQFHSEGHIVRDIARGKILASLFFEPSTRTRFSFESAMYRLGGQVISLENALASSIQKGETLSDMGRVMSGYCDIAVMRHPNAYSVDEFSRFATIPVINAGDGPRQHPTQSLLDLYTIRHFQKRLDGLVIGLVGDLKFGRTVHSLVRLLSYYYGITFYLISHPSLKLEPEMVQTLTGAGHTVIETTDFHRVIPELDVLYMTRIQQERFATYEDYHDVKDHFLLTPEILEGCKKTLSILHPLPRVNEISIELDRHPSACFFDQARFGLYVRMALIAGMLG
jgi:aspartate carbamoyltransferase catalytic subunit